MIEGALTALSHQFERLGQAGRPNEEECAALAGSVVAIRDIAARATIVKADRNLRESVLLLDGFLCRQSELPDGRRQILAIHVPGDFVDLHGLLLGRLDHDVVTLSRARIALASHAGLREITVRQPDLARKLWFVTAVDAAIHRQWIAMLARPAAERLAHLLCEVQARLAAVGMANEHGYILPLTQADFADAAALTPVHVNRTLRYLRERNLVECRGGRVVIHDLAGLQRLALFDPSYLYLNRSDV